VVSRRPLERKDTSDIRKGQGDMHSVQEGAANGHVRAVFLRDFNMKDWDALNAIISDPKVTRFMHFASWDEMKRREWFAQLVWDGGNQKREGYNYVVRI
jgi:hypothetical protein